MEEKAKEKSSPSCSSPPPSLQPPGPRLREDRVVLLGDPDKRRSLAQFLESGSSHVGAGGAQPPEDVQDGVFHIPSVRYLHSLALRSPGEEISHCIHVWMQNMSVFNGAMWSLTLQAAVYKRAPSFTAWCCLLLSSTETPQLHSPPSLRSTSRQIL